MSRPRVLLAKPGLDGIAMALRDAGAEVIYLGLRRSVPEILQAAVDEDADVIGISVLSGAHVTLVAELLEGRTARGVDVPIVLGGTIPAGDADALRALGVAAVYPVGSSLSDVVDGVLAVGSRQEVRG